MKRWAWNSLCLASLVMFLGTLAFWTLSYFSGMELAYARHTSDQRPERYIWGWLCSAHGSLGFGVAYQSDQSPLEEQRPNKWSFSRFPPRHDPPFLSPELHNPLINRLGFGF